MKYLLFVFFIICATPQTGLSLEISFHKTATVKGSTINLGDIAEFNEKSELAKALATQTVGQAPPPGQTIFLRSPQIRKYLISSQSLPADIYWKGSPTVALKREGITIGPDKILHIIENFIAENKENLPEANISFTPGTLPLPFTLPVGKLSFEIIPSHPGILGSSRFSIIFRIDNRVVKNMSVKGKVKAMANVVTASRAVKKGTILLSRHLTMKKTDISSVSSPGRDPAEFIGKKLKRHLRPGSLILLSMVEALPVVRYGERVKIIINTGSMILTATGLAHSNGQINQMIRVQNLNSHKIIYCRVTAPGLVEVLL